jgi:predicted lysophospholipase L1 biosynthesis ABC-type transport system permease subunit
LALGSSSGRLFRLLVSESVQLAIVASLAALAAAWWGGSLLRSLLMPEVKWADNPLHWRVLLLGIGAAVIAGIAAGIIPAWQSRSPDLTKSLKTGAREGGVTRSRLRGFLVATQAALSVVLLVGAALFVQCLHNVKARDIGLTVDKLAFASVTQGNDPARRAAISNQLIALQERFAVGDSVFDRLCGRRRWETGNVLQRGVAGVFRRQWDADPARPGFQRCGR